MTSLSEPGRATPAGVVHVRPFRRLWLVLGLSSLGDWLGLLATSTFAAAQVRTSAAQGAAFGGIIAVQLLPSLVLGPVAGVLADRFDRRRTMAIADIARFLLFASIPLAAVVLPDRGAVIGWAAFASFWAQVAAMVWNPAKEAAVPNLLRRDQVQTANQLTIATTDGITPVLGALVFAGLTRLPSLGRTDAAAVALYFDALTFAASAAVVWFGVREISGHRQGPPERENARAALWHGWRELTGTPLLRGLVIGLLGAFSGAGIVIGSAKFYARSLGGGDATFGLLFAGLFAGFGLGVVAGPRIASRISRRRTFAFSLVLAGGAVMVLSVMPRLGGAIAAVLVVGLGAGLALLSGVTLIGTEVADEVRGRVFAFVQTSARTALLLAISASSAFIGAVSSRRLPIGDHGIPIASSRVLFVVAGACGVSVGVSALHQMDDRREIPVLADLRQALLPQRWWRSDRQPTTARRPPRPRRPAGRPPD